MASVAILMSVKNGAETLPQALESIAQQTLPDWQAIIVDDTSTDATPQILRAWGQQQGPARVRIITHQKNQGLTSSLNEAAATTQAEYIARLDADDWWAPEKLTRQIKFLQQNQDIGIVGCQYVNIRGEEKQRVRLPTSDAAIRRRIWWRNPFGHSCVVMRCELFEKAGRYNKKLAVGQDLDLWFRLLPLTHLANLPEVLCYRALTANPAKRKQQMQQTIQTARKYRRLYSKPWWYELALAEAFVFYWLR